MVIFKPCTYVLNYVSIICTFDDFKVRSDLRKGKMMYFGRM